MRKNENDFLRKIFEVPDVQNSKQAQKTTPLTSKSPLLDKDCSKCIALTFDDGPGIYTDKLLSYHAPSYLLSLGKF